MVTRSLSLGVPMLLIGLMALGAVYAVVPAGKPGLEAVRKAFEAGQFKEAFEGARAIALDPKEDPKAAAEGLYLAVESLRKLGRVEEVDDFREAVLKAQPVSIR